MANKEIIEIFESTNALLNGHFVLTSGKHSNQYFQCAQVLQHTKHMEKICTTIADHFKDFEIDVVISPAIGGICVGQEVARQLGKRFIFAERKTKDLELRRNFEIKEGEKVLVCEDVVTTGGSVFEVINIVKERKGDLVGVGIIVDRSNGKADFGVPTKSTLALEVVTYDPEDCPLCKEGVEIVKPGSRK